MNGVSRGFHREPKLRYKSEGGWVQGTPRWQLQGKAHHAAGLPPPPIPARMPLPGPRGWSTPHSAHTPPILAPGLPCLSLPTAPHRERGAERSWVCFTPLHGAGAAAAVGGPGASRGGAGGLPPSTPGWLAAASRPESPHPCAPGYRDQIFTEHKTSNLPIFSLRHARTWGHLTRR